MLLFCVKTLAMDLHGFASVKALWIQDSQGGIQDSQGGILANPCVLSGCISCGTLKYRPGAIPQPSTTLFWLINFTMHCVTPQRTVVPEHVRILQICDTMFKYISEMRDFPNPVAARRNVCRLRNKFSTVSTCRGLLFCWYCLKESSSMCFFRSSSSSAKIL